MLPCQGVVLGLSVVLLRSSAVADPGLEWAIVRRESLSFDGLRANVEASLSAAADVTAAADAVWV